MKKAQEKFIHRGLTSRENAKCSGIYVSSSAVIENLKSRLASRRKHGAIGDKDVTRK